MIEDTTIPFRSPAFRDELSELVREGAYGAQALETGYRKPLQTGGVCFISVLNAGDASPRPHDVGRAIETKSRITQCEREAHQTRRRDAYERERRKLLDHTRGGRVA